MSPQRAGPPATGATALGSNVARFQHFVITRFSIRPTMASTDRHELNRTMSRFRGLDPLTPRSLEHRFRLFEVACLPAVLAQTDQDFTWVIVVDRDLPAAPRARLEALIADRPRTVIHTYDPSRPLGGLAWLVPYVEVPAPDYLLTTNLDDDDALPRGFAAAVHTLIEERGDQLAPVQTFGATDLWEWDLEVSDEAPLGQRAPWHREIIPVVSVGFSLLARYPAYELTVMRVAHNTARTILDWSKHADDERIQATRAVLQAGAARAGDSLGDFGADEVFSDWVPLGGMPTMTNHQINVQGARLYEAKERTPVTGPESFPDTALDWNAFRRHAPHFRRSRTLYARYLLMRARGYGQRMLAQLRQRVGAR